MKTQRRLLDGKAWEILNDDEQMAIDLSIFHNKSTWEAGEILGKPHYKFLEILRRAEYFIRLFTEYFEQYDDLVPETINIALHFREYLQLTIEERRSITDTIKLMQDERYSIKSARFRLITEQLKAVDAQGVQGLAFHSLISEFDRWNNFRILPLDLQQPSAFIRRNKMRNLRHIKNLTSLPLFSIQLLIKKYSHFGPNPLFVPIISRLIDDEFHIMKIKNDKKIIDKISDIGLFIYPALAKAEECAKIIAKYLKIENKSPKEGQKFWPEFRVIMQDTINYKRLENISKSKTYLEKAISGKSEKIKVEKRKKRKKDYLSE